jgi:phosphoribosylaminoimidazole-succinocarboxamide synthase
MKYGSSVPSLNLIHQGKTRDTFELPDKGELLIVATDRLSTHNVVHHSSVPKKGEVLTALTIFWFTKVLPANINNHLVAYGADIYKHLPTGEYPKNLHHRAIVVKKLEMIPVEFIYRSFMTGSLWKRYKKDGSNQYGLNLLPDLKLMSQFNPLIFTPTDKSENDEPLNAESVFKQHYGATTMTHLAHSYAKEYLRILGIELVDSKFEVGVDAEGRFAIADEFCTPDSSRFCESSSIQEGVDPPWLDKQIARDVAEKCWGENEKTPLHFEASVLEELTQTYVGLCSRVLGQSLAEFQQELDTKV